MAIYHLSTQVIGRSSGRSSTAAAAYRAGEMVMDERTGRHHDFTRKRGISYTEILAPNGAPSWVYDRSDLWNKVEKTEKRKDAQLCREINIALPFELSRGERLELIREYVVSTFVSAGMVADLCIHAPTNRADDHRNHHAHIMLTMRRLDGDNFGGKERSWNAPELLMQWRERWADAANKALEKAGHSVRIDHRSHTERGIEEMPGQHHGPIVSDILARGAHSEVAERIEGECAAREKAQLAAQMAIAKAQASATAQELEAVQAEANAADAKARKEREAAEAAAQALAAAAANDQAKAEAQAVAEQQARVQARQERAAVEAAALAQAEADAQVLAAQMQVLRDQAASKAQEAADQAQALAQAWLDHAAAEKVLADAVQAKGAAQAQVDELRPAHDEAVQGQRQAGLSVLLTAKALVLGTALAWSRAIAAYNGAAAVLQAASDAVQRAVKAVAQALARVLQLDPSIGERQAAAQAAQIEAQRAEKERQQQIKTANSARLRELLRPAGWRPEQPLPEPFDEYGPSQGQERSRDRERGG